MVEKKSSKSEDVRGFLKQEYNALISLYIHYENGVSSIFNFYLTLLSTITGATIVLFQLGDTNITSILPTFGILILLALALGVVVQEAILNKNIDLAYVTQAINLLKYEALKDNPEAQEYVDYLHNPFIKKHSFVKAEGLSGHLERRLWFLKWVGSHQLFISLFNSLELSLLVFVLIVYLAPGLVPIFRIAIACVIVLVLGLFTNAIYANFEFQRRLRARSVRIADQKKPALL